MYLLTKIYFGKFKWNVLWTCLLTRIEYILATNLDELNNMWIELTPEEKKRFKGLKRRRAVKHGIIFFLVIFLFSLLFDKVIGEYDGMDQAIGERLNWTEIYGSLIKYILMGLCTTIYIYVYIRNDERSTYICLKCGKSKNLDKIFACDCGGEFKCISDLKWKDENENSR